MSDDKKKPKVIDYDTFVHFIEASPITDGPMRLSMPEEGTYDPNYPITWSISGEKPFPELSFTHLKNKRGDELRGEIMREFGKFLKQRSRGKEEIEVSDDPWDQLNNEVQNKITSFISGKSYKPYYKFLLSVFELNRDSLQNKTNTAAVELAENQEWYNKINDEPKSKKMKRELIRDYKAENPQ